MGQRVSHVYDLNKKEQRLGRLKSGIYLWYYGKVEQYIILTETLINLANISLVKQE
jgi:hypothetical protein